MPDCTVPLRGRGIAITRPLDQARELAALVADAGGEPLLFPLLAIAPLADYSAFEQKLDDLTHYDWAIFISSNAVQQAMPRLLDKLGAVPEHLRFAAIGPSTAAELAKFGIHDVLQPADRFDSESLLALPQLQQLAQQRIMIFRGSGGRELLAKTLTARGALVDYGECYRRLNPQTDASALTALWQNGKLHAVVVSSSEAMRNLLLIAESGHAQWLRDIVICVSHARIGELAQRLGLRVGIADAPGDSHMLSCLIKALTH